MAFEISNIYENIVSKRVTELYADDKDIDQDKMIDIVCLALNRLPARYVRHAVDAFSAMSSEEHIQQNNDVDAAIRFAADLVRNRRTDEH